MSKSIVKRIEWEHPPEGMAAVIHDLAPRITGPGSALKNLAAAKMTDVSVISADFGGEQLVYDPWGSVLLDTGDTLIFRAAYGLSFPLDEHQDDLPHVCLRMCSWDRETDFLQFDKAEDKRDYLTSDKQVHSDILFGSFSRAVSFQALLSRLSGCVEKGVDGQRIERSNAAWHTVTVDIAADYFSWRFSYSLASFMSKELEDWIESWQEAFKQSASDFTPTGVTQISYHPSLAERIGNA